MSTDNRYILAPIQCVYGYCFPQEITFKQYTNYQLSLNYIAKMIYNPEKCDSFYPKAVDYCKTVKLANAFHNMQMISFPSRRLKMKYY